MNTRGLFDLNQATVQDEVQQEDAIQEEHGEGDAVHGEGDAVQEEHGEAAHQFDLNIQAEEDEFLQEPGIALYP